MCDIQSERNLPIPYGLLLVPALLVLAACGTLEVGIERTATPGDVAAARVTALETRVATPGTSIRTATGPRPTPTSILDGSHLSFNEPALGLSLDIPLWWETQTTPGAVTQFFQRDHTGAQQSVLTISVLNPESNTLESALEEVTQGAWGPYIRDVQPVTLGAFETLRLELSPGADRPPMVWLVVAPSGRAVGIIPQVDPALIEPVIEVVLDTLRPINSATSETTLSPTVTPTPATSFPPTDYSCHSPFYMVWSSHRLDELSGQVQAALDAAGIEDAQAYAEAFGEDWFEYDEATGKDARLCNFSVKATDFYITLQTETITDLETLGALLTEVLTVLDGFPPQDTPGPQPGNIEIVFVAGDKERRLWFSVTEAANARDSDLDGAALLEALRFQP